MLTAQTFTYACDTYKWWQNAFIRAVELMTGQRKIYKLYDDYRTEGLQDKCFYDEAIRRLDLTVNYDMDKLNAIPKTGALVVVANHPYGVLDGLIINQMMARVRDDFKVLTNGVLCQAPEANKNLLPIDFSGTEEALKTNLQTRKEAREILKTGGCIVVFPAGGVSSTPTWKDKVAQDTQWQPFVGSLIHGAKAAVLPVFFEGQNSRLFQIISAVSLTARVALYFKELADRIGSQVGVVIGTAIKYQDLEIYKDKAELVDYLRCKTYALGGIGSLKPVRPAYRMNKTLSHT